MFYRLYISIGDIVKGVQSMIYKYIDFPSKKLSKKQDKSTNIHLIS